MAFLMSLPIVLRRTMGLKYLGESYNFLLGLGIMIEVEILKCKGQKPVLKQMSAILMMFFRHTMSFMMILRCLHNNLLEPEVDELLHLQMAFLNFALENKSHITDFLLGSSFKRLLSICQSYTFLKVE